MSRFAVNIVVYTLLRDLAEGRVYHLPAPLNAPQPLVVFHIDADRPQLFFDFSSAVDAEVVVAVFGESSAGIEALTRLQDELIAAMGRRPPRIKPLGPFSVTAIDRGQTSIRGDAMCITSRWRIQT